MKKTLALLPLITTSCFGGDKLENFSLEIFIDNSTIITEDCTQTLINFSIDTDQRYNFVEFLWSELIVEGYEITDDGFVLESQSVGGELLPQDERTYSVKVNFIGNGEITCAENKFKISI